MAREWLEALFAFAVRSPGAAAAAVLLVVVAVLWVAWRRARDRVRRGNRARQELAYDGERRAVKLLAREGYRVVERQLSRYWSMEVDGEPVEVGCRADLLVIDSAGDLYVAEVKTGDLAPDPTRSTTRRQLLEYWLVFDVDGVLLVDMAARRVHTVSFGLRERIAGRDRRGADVARRVGRHGVRRPVGRKER